jgi:hypothetical protein
MQRSVEGAPQEGLSRYERGAGRVQFRGAETNLAQSVARIEADKKRPDKRTPWQPSLANARLPIYDVRWTPAALQGTVVVLENKTGRVLAMDRRFSYPLSQSARPRPCASRAPPSSR